MAQRNPAARQPRTRRIAGFALFAPALLLVLFLITDALAPVDLEPRSGTRLGIAHDDRP